MWNLFARLPRLYKTSSTKVVHLTCLGLALFLLSGGMIPARAQEGEEAPPPPPTLVISQNAAAFPEISLDVIIQSNNRAIEGLGAEDFELGEAHQNLQVEPLYDQPTATVIVIDLSGSSDDDLIHSTLLAYMNTSYQEGDILAFYVSEGEESFFQEITTRAQADPVINSLFSGGDGGYSIASALDFTFRYLQIQKEAQPTITSQVIVLASYLYASNLSESVSPFQEANIPLHVIQAHRGRQSSTADMQSLAQAGGGLFIDNQNGQFLFGQATGQIAATGGLSDLFSSLQRNRLRYHLSYQTQSQDLAPVRQVRLSATLPDGQVLVGDFSYSPSFEPPQISIIAPTDINPTRIVAPDGSFDISQNTLVAKVSFSDVPRNITLIRLDVLDPLTGEAVQAPMEYVSFEQDENGNFLIPWSLEPYSTFGQSYSVTLSLSVSDELGLIANIQQEATVTVTTPPILPTSTALPTYTPLPTLTSVPTFTPQPTFTPLPTLTSVPTFTPQPTFTPFPTPSPQATLVPLAEVTVETSNTDDLNRISVAILGIVAINLVGMVLFLRRTNTGQQIAGQSASVVRTAIYRAKTNIFRRPGEKEANDTSSANLLAKLVVIHGLPGVEAIPVDRPRFIIGRETAAGCNYAIPLPHLSSQHLTIFYKKNLFTLMDMNSSNGTYLDGHKLTPNREYPLQDGARILIVNDVELEFHPLTQGGEFPQNYTPTPEDPAEPPDTSPPPEAPTLSLSPEVRRATGLRPAFSQQIQSEGPSDEVETDRQQRNWQALPSKKETNPKPDTPVTPGWDPFDTDK